MAMDNVLCSEGKGSRCDGRWQVEALYDLLPQLLVDDVDESTAGDDQVVQFVQVQHLFGHNRQTSNRSPYKENIQI